MNRRKLILTAPLALLGASGFWVLNRSDTSTSGLGAALAQENTEATVDTSRVVEMSLGSPEADVTVVEYASFTCPHCRNFHAEVFPRLKQDYIDTGKINFIYREVYFDRFGLWAGMVARCGGEQRYFGIVDMLYESQSEWVAGGDPAQIAQNLRKIGKKAALSDAELDACMNDGEQAQALVASYQENAKADEIDSTPSFIIDGEKYSNMSYEDFAGILDEKLAG